MPFCFAFYGGSKALVYYFFVRRAKAAVIGVFGLYTQCHKMLFEYVAPILLLVYWFVYCSVTSFLFSGGRTMVDEKGILSFCVLDEYQLWFIILAGVVDLVMCIGSLSLFIPPLLKSINQFNEIMARNEEKYANCAESTELVKLMKWNVCLTAIASVSSVVTITTLPLTHDYIWIFCLADPLINALCIFLMIGPNRTCCAKSGQSVLRQCCCINATHELELVNFESTTTGSHPTKSKSVMNTIREHVCDDIQSGIANKMGHMHSHSVPLKEINVATLTTHSSKY